MPTQNVMIHILTTRVEFPTSLFPCEEDLDGNPSHDNTDALASCFKRSLPQSDETLIEGRMESTSSGIILKYAETEQSGMAGSDTWIEIQYDHPQTVSMVRTGQVRTALTFETGKRHVCLYYTPFSTFEVCVRTFHVENRLFAEGTLKMDYAIEVHGAPAERCKMIISIRQR